MNHKKLFTGCILMLSLALSALAIPTVQINWAPNHSQTGGEFVMSPSDGPDFNTFCIERDQYISVGSTYAYEISDRADSGNDPLCLGTAWLYSNFRNGNLLGYHSTTDQQRLLQEAFWYLEGEVIIQNPLANPWLLLASQNVTNMYNDADGAFGVVVWNLRTPTGAPAQSQLGLSVPDGGGTLTLAGLGLIGLLVLPKAMNYCRGCGRIPSHCRCGGGAKIKQ